MIADEETLQLAIRESVILTISLFVLICKKRNCFSEMTKDNNSNNNNKLWYVYVDEMRDICQHP
jgi:hypothetical protein